MEKDDDVMRHWRGDEESYYEYDEEPSVSFIFFWGSVFAIIALLFSLWIIL